MAEVMHFLDRRPFQPQCAEALELVEYLQRVYFQQDKILAVMSRVVLADGRSALSPGDLILENQTARELWSDVLVYAASKYQLRALFTCIVEHPESSGIREKLEALRSAPPVSPEPATPDNAPRPSAAQLVEPGHWDLIARALRSHALDDGVHPALAEVLPVEWIEEAEQEADSERRLEYLVGCLKESPVDSPKPLVLKAMLGLLAIESFEEQPHSVFLLEAVVTLHNFLNRDREIDRLDTYVLTNGDVFLDRDGVRKGLEHLLKQNHALVVQGDEGSGKSYTYLLAKDVAADRGVRCLKVTPDDAGSARELIDLLTETLLPDSPLYRNTPPDRAKWISHSTQWLVSKLRAQQRPLWLVFDGFAENRLNSEMRDVLAKLVFRMWDQGDGAIKAVFVDYGGALPPELGQLKQVEEISVLERRHLREFFVHHYSENPPVEDELAVEAYVENSVRDVWKKAELRYLAQRSGAAGRPSEPDEEPDQGEPEPEEPEHVVLSPFMKHLQDAVHEEIR